MNDARLGIVRLPLPDGRQVAIRFTWARIDAVGRDWIVERFQDVINGKPGCQAALVELLVLASGGELSASDMLSDEKEPLPFEEAYRALEDAWLLARFGPTRKASGQPENPRTNRLTWWRRFFQRS